MFCGDEDNGEVSSWYLLSALGAGLIFAELVHIKACLTTAGLYALQPSTPDYVLGSPLFSSVRITLDNVAPGERTYTY
jgi:putative alpha-1,2-mannosidase